VVQQANRAAAGDSGKESASVEAVKGATPAPDQPAPRSDSPLDNGPTATGSIVENSAAPVPSASLQPNTAEAKPDAPDPNELKPNVAGDSAQSPTPPQQVNEIQQASADPAAAKAGDPASQDTADDSYVSSSKKKKKKGLHKVVPF